MTAPIDWGDEPEQQPARHSVDTITDGDLDQLYAELAENVGVIRALRRQRDEAEQRAEQAETKAAAMTALLREAAAADALRHRGCRRELMGQCMRAEQAEAALERVRALANSIALDSAWGRTTADRIRAVLNAPKEPRP